VSAPADTITRQILNSDEVGKMAGLSGRGVRNLVAKNGHVLGVAPVPDTGRRVVFSRVLIERALGLAS
jgi:hypothetical protein